MRLDAADVLEVAERARLRLAAGDAERLAAELTRVLEWADALLPAAGGADAGGAVGTAPGASSATVAAPRAAPVAPDPAVPTGPLRPDLPLPSPGAVLLAESGGRDGALVRVPAVR